MTELKAPREGSSSTQSSKESCPSTPTGDRASDAGKSEISVTTDHLSEYIHMLIVFTATDIYINRELNKKNEEERLQAEEKEVAALLILEVDYEGDTAMDTECEDGKLEYVSDSEGDLLLSPPAGLQSPSRYRYMFCLHVPHIHCQES